MENLTEKDLTDIFGNKFLSPKNYSALTLAYIGDCVYELYVRGYLIQKSDQKVNLLHKTSTRFVCAKAQAELYHKIKDMLSEDETAVFHLSLIHICNIIKHKQIFLTGKVKRLFKK